MELTQKLRKPTLALHSNLGERLIKCLSHLSGSDCRTDGKLKLVESTFSFLLVFSSAFDPQFQRRSNCFSRGSIQGWWAFSHLEWRHGISFSVIKGLSEALLAAPVQVPTSLPPSPSSGVKAKMGAGIEDNWWGHLSLRTSEVIPRLPSQQTRCVWARQR